jgi:MFS family permease
MVSRQGNGSQQQGGAGAFASFRVWGSLGYVVVSLLIGWLLGQRLAAGATMSRAAIAPVFLYGPLIFALVAGVILLLPDPKRTEPMVETDSGASPAIMDEAQTLSEQRTRAHNLTRFFRAQFLLVFAYTGSSAYLSLYLKGLGATPFWITAVFATGVLCEAIVMMQVGRLSDRFGRRPLLAVAYVFMPIRLLLYIVATGPGWVLAVQTIHGINFGVLAALAAVFVNDLSLEHNRGATQAKLAAAWGLAAALGPAFGGVFAQQLGLRANFGIMAGVAALGAAQFLWKVRESHPHPVLLYRRGPARLRSVLSLLSIPANRLPRRAKAQKESK